MFRFCTVLRIFFALSSTFVSARCFSASLIVALRIRSLVTILISHLDTDLFAYLSPISQIQLIWSRPLKLHCNTLVREQRFHLSFSCRPLFKYRDRRFRNIYASFMLVRISLRTFGFCWKLSYEVFNFSFEFMNSFTLQNLPWTISIKAKLPQLSSQTLAANQVYQLCHEYT